MQRDRVEEGKIHGLVGAEAELFRLFADTIPTLAWMANADGYIIWYNRRWHEYCGSTPQEMEDWGWQSVHDPRELGAVLER
jgi:PAS domain-containing protein